MAGGGLLGLEAAYSLLKLGLRTTVLERSSHLLRRQLDERAGELLRGYLANLGIEVLLDAQAAAIADGVVELTDGRRVEADAFLVAAGISPSVDLARRAGLDVARGVLVDDRLRTSDERIFAVGDLAEWRGSIHGLWPVAVEQAEVAAENAVGGARPYAGTVPVTMLKVVGVELLSIGAIHGASEIVDADAESLRYRKLVLDDDGPRRRRDPARPSGARAGRDRGGPRVAPARGHRRLEGGRYRRGREPRRRHRGHRSRRHLSRPPPRASGLGRRRAQPRRARAVPAGAGVALRSGASRSTATPRSRPDRSAPGSPRSKPTR